MRPVIAGQAAVKWDVKIRNRRLKNEHFVIENIVASDALPLTGCKTVRRHVLTLRIWWYPSKGQVEHKYNKMRKH